MPTPGEVTRTLSVKRKAAYHSVPHRLVGVCSFSSSLRGFKLAQVKWRYLVPPTCGQRSLVGDHPQRKDE
jgi:hypothetical protein